MSTATAVERAPDLAAPGPAEGPDAAEKAVAEMTGPRAAVGGPSRALLLTASIAPVLLAGAARLVWPAAAAGTGSLVWLAGLVPFSILVYYRGLRGALMAGVLVVLGFVAAESGAMLWRGEAFQWTVFGVLGSLVAALVLSMGTLAEKLHRRRREAYRLAFTDPTSGLPQRRLLSLFLRQQVAAARRGEELSIALFGLTGLDDFRERHGEEAADHLVSRVGDVLLNNTRGSDVAGRWTGDRFLAVMPDTDADGARVFALRAVEKLDALAVPLSDGSLVHSDVALRIGVANFDASVQDHLDLVRRAERALGAAGAPGGRRVTVFRSREPVA